MIFNAFFQFNTLVKKYPTPLLSLKIVLLVKKKIYKSQVSFTKDNNFRCGYNYHKSSPFELIVSVYLRFQYEIID